MDIGKLFMIFCACAFAFIIILYAWEPITNPDISLEATNFTANDTYFAFAHSPVNSYSMHLYYFDNTTFEIITALYDFNTTHIKIYANGTGEYPNVTTNVNYYSSYSYQQSGTIWGVDFTFVAMTIFLVVCLVIAYTIAKSGLIKKK